MSKDIFYDKDIREPLFDFLEDSFGKVRILEEKRTGSARAVSFASSVTTSPVQSIIPPNSKTLVYPISKSFCAASLLRLPLLQ